MALGKSLTIKDLNGLRYLKACIQESFRLTPTVPMLQRMMPSDMVLQGYHIPKDTMLAWSPLIFQQHFEDFDKFQPERWLLQGRKNCPPHAVRQFGHGPRMCIGKRFADLELLIAVHQLMINFELKWVNKDPMTISQSLVCVPDQTLDFQFLDIGKR